MLAINSETSRLQPSTDEQDFARRVLSANENNMNLVAPPRVLRVFEVPPRRVV
jgi:hypothetical protein